MITCSLALSLSNSITHTHKGTFMLMLTKTCKLLHMNCAIFLSLNLSLSDTQPHHELSRLTCGAHAILEAFKLVQSHSMVVKGV